VRARHPAWAITAATAGLAVATTAFGFVDDGTRLPADEGGNVSGPGELTFAVMTVAFGALGALLASRRPRNPIGWILCVASLALGVTGLARGWYVHAVYAEPGSRPVPEALLWLANSIWVWGFIPLMTAVLLLFPDGRLPSRRWWPAAGLTGAALSALTLGYAFEPGAMDGYPRVANPLGTSGGLGAVLEFLQAIGYPLFALAAIASAAAVATRFRRSHGVERQQLKWMAAAAAVAVVAWFVNAVLDQALGVNSAFFLPLVLLSIPAAATVAILRYRLYDLGRIVNRTLVYGGLTLTLGGCYLGLVLPSGSPRGSPTWRSPPRRSRSPRCSVPPGRASRRSWTAASTAVATTPSGRSRPSPAACATRSSWRRSRPSCAAPSARPSSPPTCRCG